MALLWHLPFIWIPMFLLAWQRCQEPVSADMGFQAPLLSNIAPLTNYSRIRLRDNNELDKTYKLIERYFDQPELATAVTELVLDIPVPMERTATSEDKKKDIRPLDEENDRPLVSHVKNIGLGDEITKFILDNFAWKKDDVLTGPILSHHGVRVDDNNAQANFALSAAIVLMSIAPNVERLDISQFEPAMEEFLIRNNYGLLPPNHLQRIKHVHFLHDNGHFILSDKRFFSRFDILRALRLFHRLPSLESVAMEGITTPQNHRSTIVPHTSNLKKIHVGRSDLSSSMLSKIIRLPKHDHLEEFRYSIGGRALQDGGLFMKQPKTIGKALLAQKNSLVLLDLDLDSTFPTPGNVYSSRRWAEETTETFKSWILERERDEYFIMDEDLVSERVHWADEVPETRAYGTSIGSLHDFEALRNLSIGVALLLGFGEPTPFRLVEALPKSLESLTFRGYARGKWQEWDEQLKELMDKKAKMLPNLREVNGVEEEIPNAHFVRRPDENRDELWQPQEDTRDWEEAPPTQH